MTFRQKITVFISYFKPHRKIFFLDMLCATFIALVDLYFPSFTRYTLNNIIPQKNMKLFLFVVLIMVGLYLIRTGATFFVTYLGHTFGVDVEKDMRRDIFKHVLKQPFSFFDENRTGKLMSRMTTDLFDITELAHHGPEDLFISILTLIGSFILMFHMRWELAVIVFLFIPIMIIQTSHSRKKLSENSRKIKTEMAEINATIESSISGSRVTKIFTNETFEEKKFAKNNNDYFGAKKIYYHAMAFFTSNMQFLIQILDVVVIGVGGWLIMARGMSVTDLLTATLYLSVFRPPIRRLMNFVEQYTKGMAGFDRFLEIMNHDEQTLVSKNAVAINTARGHIVYKDVQFAYNNGITVLDNINLVISPGQSIAFVGSSGSGKTTLCNLLPRYYDIQKGSITLDGRDVRDITLDSLRKQIGLVQQDVFLFAGTIKENIAYGRLDATDEEIIEAAKQAEIHKDILAMPNGYDTIVGERGIKLSGGQKQRVSIARIFLKNPPILILDEATSALDSATEIKIQASFDKLAKGRTSMVIAHRLSTIKNADKIVVIDNKGIAEAGTHDELMAKNGMYKKLHDAQFKFQG
ncbi:MAG: thiamine ABC transporter permease [Treponema sp. CETP13]|nr:MAG: thiamine ABC transporter permease [Treponema sp. CETP13]